MYYIEFIYFLCYAVALSLSDYIKKSQSDKSFVEQKMYLFLLSCSPRKECWEKINSQFFTSQRALKIFSNFHSHFSALRKNKFFVYRRKIFLKTFSNQQKLDVCAVDESVVYEKLDCEDWKKKSKNKIIFWNF
jgi:hypothetical protein